MRWLAECSEPAVREAVDAVAPWLRSEPVALSSRTPVGGPLWWASSAAVGERHVAKFAWSEPAAIRLRHEIEVLRALGPLVGRLPWVAASGLDPLLLIVERVGGASLFDVADALDPDVAGRDLGSFLADLHRPEVRGRLVEEIAAWPPALPRRPDAQGLGRWARPDQRPLIARWLHWADRVLAAPGEPVVVHGDFHGDNQVWAAGRLQVVLDFETVALAEPEYDFRGVSSVGPSVDLLVRTLQHYERAAGRELSLDRVMAWHVRTVLGDLLWRSEAGLGPSDGRTVPEWLDDLATRLRLLDVAAG